MKARESSNHVRGVIPFCPGPQPDCIFTVGLGHGGEIGQLEEVWPDAKYFACEPHPGLINNAIGQYPGTLFPFAIGREDGETTLYHKRRHICGSSLFNRRMRGDKKITVQRRTLDSLLRDHGPFGEYILLWLDCEGSELDALDGGEKFLDSVPWINLEMSVRPVRPGWPDHFQVHSFLSKAGFFRMNTHSHVWNYEGGENFSYDALYVRPGCINWNQVSCPAEGNDRVGILKRMKREQHKRELLNL